MKNKQTKTLLFMVIALVILCGLILCIGMIPENDTKNPVNTPEVIVGDISQDLDEEVFIPWEEEGAKQPQDYSKDEYESLTPAQKDKFVESFEKEEDLKQWEEREEVVVEKYPWQTGGKQPSEYSLTEYNDLKDSHKLAFQRTFGSTEAFMSWLTKAEEDALAQQKNPWETGGKQPSEYTWKEYEALTVAQQIAFQKSFESMQAFEKWMNQAQGNTSIEVMPWENGGKQPSEYTLDEFNSLTKTQQIAFQKWFGSETEFDTWLSKVSGNNSTPDEPVVVYPWQTGGKTPAQYTLDEFNALTGEQQIAFQKWFVSDNDFNVWLTKAQDNTTVVEQNPWETGGKTPNQYTLAEFNELTGAQQLAFQKWFASDADFDAWLTSAQEDSVTNAEVPWENGEKLPNEYTWEEFEALEGPQQIAFQNWFSSSDDFNNWLTNAQNDSSTQTNNPWETTGSKQPKDYTWEEFENLTGAQQIEFQNYLGQDGFESWMNSTLNN